MARGEMTVSLFASVACSLHCYFPLHCSFLVGTDVAVFGARFINAEHDAPSNETNWECFVDGHKLPASVEPYGPLCGSGDLRDGTHDLLVKVSSSAVTSFWLDYVLFTPSPVATRSNANVLAIDNTDAAIRYDDQWNVSGDMTSASSAGAKAEVDFTGTYSSSCFVLLPAERFSR